MTDFSPTNIGLIPTQIPNCVAWMDAADTSTDNITSSGGLVSAIDNKANSQIPFTQGTGAAQPTTNSLTIAGKNALSFDGTNDRLGANGLSAYFTTGTAPFTAFVVGYTNTITGGARGIWGASFSTSRYISSFRSNNSAFMEIGSENNAGGFKDITSSNALVNTTPFALTTVYDGTNVSNYQDASTINTGTTFANGAITLDTFSIGSILAANFYWNGAIGEFILYNRALTSTERLTVQRYLGQKWGTLTA